MIGVVLAGGHGTRFHPVTRVTNKHLLDVFDEPMIYHPIRSLKQAGISDLVLVTGEEIDQFKTLLGNGQELGVNLVFVKQVGALGIAAALSHARPHVGADGCVVILGDNIFQDDLSPYVTAFEAQSEGARLLLKRTAVEDAKRFGVAVIEGAAIIEVVEKAEQPPSDLVVTGCYMYPPEVFDIIETLTPSERNELEITDVNNAFVASSGVRFDILSGWWTDAGTPPSKLKASILVALNKGVTFHGS